MCSNVTHLSRESPAPLTPDRGEGAMWTCILKDSARTTALASSMPSVKMVLSASLKRPTAAALARGCCGTCKQR